MAYPPGPDFLAAVMDRLDVEGPTELTRLMGWDINTPSLIGKWRKGTSEPSYAYVMAMLDKCGWLSMDAASPVTRNEDDELLDQALEEIGAVLVRLVSRVSERGRPPDAATSRRTA